MSIWIVLKHLWFPFAVSFTCLNENENYFQDFQYPSVAKIFEKSKFQVQDLSQVFNLPEKCDE